MCILNFQFNYENLIRETDNHRIVSCDQSAISEATKGHPPFCSDQLLPSRLTTCKLIANTAAKRNFFIQVLCCYRSRLHGLESYCPRLYSAHFFVFLTYFSPPFLSIFFYRFLVSLFHFSVCIFFSLFSLFTMFSFISPRFFFLAFIRLPLFFVLFLQSLQ